MAKKPAYVDPLEAAKIARPVFTPPPAPAAPAALPPLPAPVAAPAERYRVRQTTTVSILGQLVNLPADSIVSADIYGPRGFACILDSNAPLEKL